MNEAAIVLRYVAIIVHGLAGCAIIGLLSMTGAMTAFCLLAAVLAACLAVFTARGRPVTLYAGFGLLLGYSFWALVTAVVQRDFLAFVPMLLVTAAAFWLLLAPGWPSAAFCSVAILVALVIAALALARWRDDPEPERARKSAVTAIGVLIVAGAYVGIGFAEAYVAKAQARPGRRRRPRRDDEDD